jgi:hypothetical protein
MMREQCYQSQVNLAIRHKVLQAQYLETKRKADQHSADLEDAEEAEEADLKRAKDAKDEVSSQKLPFPCHRFRVLCFGYAACLPRGKCDGYPISRVA